MRILIALALLSSPPATPMAMPGWMAGKWCVQATAETCERWGSDGGGMMLGTSQTVKQGRTTGFEFLRIAMDGDVPVYLAQPGGKPAVAFRATAADGQSITFLNAEHDYPQRIRYWRTGDVLNAEIALADGSNAMRWSYLRVRGD